MELYLQDVARLPALRSRRDLHLLVRQVQRADVARQVRTTLAMGESAQVVPTLYADFAWLYGASMLGVESSTLPAATVEVVERYFAQVLPGDTGLILSAPEQAPALGDFDDRCERAWLRIRRVALLPVALQRELRAGEPFSEPAFLDHLHLLEEEGIVARRTLLEGTLRWSLKIARSYLGQGVPYLDLVQEGSFGLSDACTKFQEWKGSHFQAYAMQWIRQRMGRYVATAGRRIRIPVHVYEDVHERSRRRETAVEPDALADAHDGIIPTPSLSEEQAREIAQYQAVQAVNARLGRYTALLASVKGLTPEDRPLERQAVLMRACKGAAGEVDTEDSRLTLFRQVGWLTDDDMALLALTNAAATKRGASLYHAEARAARKQIWREQMVNSWEFSLHERIAGDDGQSPRTLAELLPDPCSPFDQPFNSMLCNQLLALLAEINGRSHAMLVMRFGLADDREQTLEEIGERYGLTRERVRQVEANALRQLRHPVKSRVLRGWETDSIDPAYAYLTGQESLPAMLALTEEILRGEAADAQAEESEAIDRLLVRYAHSLRQHAPGSARSGRAGLLCTLLRDEGRPLHHSVIHARAQAMTPDAETIPAARTYALLYYNPLFRARGDGVFGLAEWSTESADNLPAAYCPYPFVNQRRAPHSFFESLLVGADLLRRTPNMPASHFYAALAEWAGRASGSANEAQAAFDAWAAAGLVARLDYIAHAHTPVASLFPVNAGLAALRTYCLNHLCQFVARMPETLLVLKTAGPAPLPLLQKLLFGGPDEGRDMQARLAMLAAFDAVREEAGAWRLTAIGAAALEANPAPEGADFTLLSSEDATSEAPDDDLVWQYEFELFDLDQMTVDA